jgi:alpha-tubulin suppressor-like RCC1 family protein
MAFRLAVLSLAVGTLPACGGGSSPASDAGQDSGVDGGTDAATDAGTDTDTVPGDEAVWVSAGSFHTCAVIEGGYVKCWGAETFGEFGYGYYEGPPDGVDYAKPWTLPFVDVGGPVAQIDAGGYHTCALLTDGTARCWGYNSLGQLGVNTGESMTIGENDVPADHAPIDFGGLKVRQISAAVGNFTCALLEDGTLQCFGDNQYGQTGSGTIDLGSPAVGVCTGVAHSCGVLENGDVYCWGAGAGGVLGYGDTDNVYSPLTTGPVDVGGAATQIACGSGHTCALLDTGDVECWGNGEYGALGYGNTDNVGDDEVPADVGPVDVDAKVTQVTAGSHHTCVIIEGGDVKCWGQGAGGQLGYGNADSVGVTNVPADVGTVDVGEPVVRIEAGQGDNCVLTTFSTVRCWGTNYVGELGYGTSDPYIGNDETPASMGDVPLL